MQTGPLLILSNPPPPLDFLGGQTGLDAGLALGFVSHGLFFGALPPNFGLHIFDLLAFGGRGLHFGDTVYRACFGEQGPAATFFFRGALGWHGLAE